MKPILSPAAKALTPHNVSEENLYEAGVPVSRHVMSPNLLQPQNVETQQVYYLWARRTRRRHVSRIIDQSFSDQSQPSIRILCAAFLGNPLHCSVPCMKSITTSCSARSVNQLPPEEQTVNDEDSIGKDYGASSGDVQCLHIMMARLAVNLAGT